MVYHIPIAWVQSDKSAVVSLSLSPARPLQQTKHHLIVQSANLPINDKGRLQWAQDLAVRVY